MRLIQSDLESLSNLTKEPWYETICTVIIFLLLFLTFQGKRHSSKCLLLSEHLPPA